MPFTYSEVCASYTRLPKISFDYEVVEKTTHLKAVPFSGMWKDLGTWNTLTEEMSGMNSGNVVLGKGNANTHVINELDVPLVVAGISDSVVVATYDGVLVSSKQESPHVKDILKDVPIEPMYEEKRWGWIKTLDISHGIATKKVCMYASSDPIQFSLSSSCTWQILCGNGSVKINQEKERKLISGVSENFSHGDVVNILVDEDIQLIALCAIPSAVN